LKNLKKTFSVTATLEMKVAALFLRFFKDVIRYAAKFQIFTKIRVTMATFGNLGVSHSFEIFKKIMVRKILQF
jgi:hypothetical protein